MRPLFHLSYGFRLTIICLAFFVVPRTVCADGLLPSRCVFSQRVGRVVEGVGSPWEEVTMVSNRLDLAVLFSAIISTNLTHTSPTLCGRVCKLDFLDESDELLLSSTVYRDGVFLLEPPVDEDRRGASFNENTVYVFVKDPLMAEIVLKQCRLHIPAVMKEIDTRFHQLGPGRTISDLFAAPPRAWSPPRVGMPAEWYNLTGTDVDSLRRRWEIQQECREMEESLAVPARKIAKQAFAYLDTLRERSRSPEQ